MHICVTAVCFTLFLHDATIRNAMLEACVAPSHLLSSATGSLAAYGLLPGTPHQRLFFHCICVSAVAAPWSPFLRLPEAVVDVPQETNRSTRTHTVPTWRCMLQCFD